MEEPILTIGIPTYNRPRNIQETVRLLLPQLNDKVRLVVYDNCSEPPVSSLFSETEKKQFAIIRNKANIGGDANIAGVIYNANTKWVWDLGDDDFPMPNAISLILHEIEINPDALLLKFNTYKQCVTRNFEELVELCKYRYMFSNLLFISTGVYNREKLAGDLFYYYKNLSSMVGQSILILKHLEREEDIIYFNSKKIVHHSVDGIEKEQGKKEKERIKERDYWDKVTFVKRSSLIFDEFANKRKYLNKNLFKGITLEYLRIVLDTEMTNMNFYQRFDLFNFVRRTVGFWNIIRYNSHVLGQYFLMYILPNGLYNQIRSKAKKNYVNNNK